MSAAILPSHLRSGNFFIFWCDEHVHSYRVEARVDHRGWIAASQPIKSERLLRVFPSALSRHRRQPQQKAAKAPWLS